MYPDSDYKEAHTMTYPEKVKSHLWADIRMMSEDPGRFAKNPDADFSRERKLGFEGLMQFLISMQSGTTGHELLEFFDYSTDVISNSGFIQQRDKLLPTAFRHLLLEFNSHFPFKLYRGKYQLIACDGCEFVIARNPDDPDTYHPNRKDTRGHNMLHTTSLFDLINKRYLDCEVQPGRLKNEFRAICNFADRFPKSGNPVFIGDRGFACYNFFAHAFENNLFFLIRAKDLNIKRYLGLKTLPEFLDTNVELILTRTQSRKKWVRPDLKDQYRFVSKDVAFDYIEHDSGDEYHFSLRIVRVEVADGVFENLVSNLPFDEVSADELKKWYNLRWGIETSFRHLKHTIGTDNFHSRIVANIELEIWARMILFNFCAIITMYAVVSKKTTKYVYQVNFAMAMKICHHFIRLKISDKPPDLLGLIGSITLPIRPDRSFHRRNRLRVPLSFCYRPN